MDTPHQKTPCIFDEHRQCILLNDESQHVADKTSAFLAYEPCTRRTNLEAGWCDRRSSCKPQMNMVESPDKNAQ
eukprot:m.199906 g.199906  ORF g.199906 m.199906 type:complete len:74 (+) comp15325_c0_seq10:1317-1538(+)